MRVDEVASVCCELQRLDAVYNIHGSGPHHYFGWIDPREMLLRFWVPAGLQLSDAIASTLNHQFNVETIVQASTTQSSGGTACQCGSVQLRFLF
jgi:hypothetical protein